MGYNLLTNGVLGGYNPLTNNLLTSWDILVVQVGTVPTTEESWDWKTFSFSFEMMACFQVLSEIEKRAHQSDR